ncbi:MAG: hypothetical protein ACM336_21530 [Acidobacteriota bacterium]
MKLAIFEFYGNYPPETGSAGDKIRPRDVGHRRAPECVVLKEVAGVEVDSGARWSRTGQSITGGSLEDLSAAGARCKQSGRKKP